MTFKDATPYIPLTPVGIAEDVVACAKAGTLNWGIEIFENSLSFLSKLGLKVQELDNKPEVEVFDASMIGTPVHLMKSGVLRTPGHFQFVLGVPGGLDCTWLHMVHHLYWKNSTSLCSMPA